MRKIEIEEKYGSTEVCVIENKRLASMLFVDTYSIKKKGIAKVLALRCYTKLISAKRLVGSFFLDSTMIDDRIRKLTIEPALYN